MGPHDARRVAPRALSELAPGVHVATGGLYTTTSTVVVAPDGTCLVVDPAITREDVDALGVAAAARGWRVAAGFSTHPHWDHVLWSRALGTAPRWATAAAVDVAERERASLTAAAAAAVDHDPDLLGVLTPLPPGPPVADGVLPWPARDVVVVEHSGHAPGSAALVVTDAGVLIAGDVLSDVEVPLLDVDADDPLGEYARALDDLEAAAERYDVDVLVPGHGHATDGTGLRRRLDEDRTYLDALARGLPARDARLADPWVRAEHERQMAALAAGLERG